MCEFCEKENELKTETGHWFILKSKKYMPSLFYRHRNCTNACGMTINYCPLCGRKLSEVSKMNVEDRMKRTLENMRESNAIDREKYNEYVDAINCWIEQIERLQKENEEQKSKISALESELSIKENYYKDKSKIYIIGCLREFDGEQYMRFSDVQDLIKALES